MKVPLIIYHDPCWDGCIAAGVVADAFDNRVIYHAARHDQPLPPTVLGEHVIIVDFSYPRKDMEYLIEVTSKLLVLDHHKSSEEALADLPQSDDVQIIFDKTMSGAGLAWEHFNKNKHNIRMPDVVKYVQDRDLWKFDYEEETRDYYNFLETHEQHPYVYRRLLHFSTTSALETGHRIGKYKKKLIERLILEGVGKNNVFYVNCPKPLFSELAALLTPDYSVVCGYYKRRDGLWEYSLRSTKVDVSEVAKNYGGGGHIQSAGFTQWTPLTEELHV